MVNNNPTKLTTTITTGSGKVSGVLVLRESGDLNNVLRRYVRGKFNLRAFGRRLAKPRCTTHFVRRMRRHNVRCGLGAVIVSVSLRGMMATAGHRSKVLLLRTGTVVLTVKYERHSEKTLGVPKCHPTKVCSTKATRRLMGVRKLVPKGRIIVLKSKSVNLVVTEHVALRKTGIGIITRLVPCSNKLGEGVMRYLSSFRVPLGLDRAIVSVRKGRHMRTIAVTRIKPSHGPVPKARRECAYSALLLSYKLLPRGRLSGDTKMRLSRIASNPIMGSSLRADISNVFTYKGMLRIRSLISFMSRRTTTTKGGTTTCVGTKRGGIRTRVLPVSPRNKIHCAIPSFMEPSRVRRGLAIHFHIKSMFGGGIVTICFSSQLVNGGGHRIITPNRVRRMVLGGGGLRRCPRAGGVAVQVRRTWTVGRERLVYVKYPVKYPVIIGVRRNGIVSIAKGAYPHKSTCTEGRMASPAHVMAAAIHITSKGMPVVGIGARRSVPGSGVFSYVTTLHNMAVGTPIRVKSVILRGITNANMGVMTTKGISTMR